MSLWRSAGRAGTLPLRHPPDTPYAQGVVTRAPGEGGEVASDREKPRGSRQTSPLPGSPPRPPSADSVSGDQRFRSSACPPPTSQARTGAEQGHPQLRHLPGASDAGCDRAAEPPTRPDSPRPPLSICPQKGLEYAPSPGRPLTDVLSDSPAVDRGERLCRCCCSSAPADAKGIRVSLSLCLAGGSTSDPLPSHPERRPEIGLLKSDGCC